MSASTRIASLEIGMGLLDLRATFYGTRFTAAERHQITAHGASRGSAPGTGPAPNGRKNTPRPPVSKKISWLLNVVAPTLVGNLFWGSHGCRRCPARSSLPQPVQHHAGDHHQSG